MRATANELCVTQTKYNTILSGCRKNVYACKPVILDCDVRDHSCFELSDGTVLWIKIKSLDRLHE